VPCEVPCIQAICKMGFKPKIRFYRSPRYTVLHGQHTWSECIPAPLPALLTVRVCLLHESPFASQVCMVMGSSAQQSPFQSPRRYLREQVCTLFVLSSYCICLGARRSKLCMHMHAHSQGTCMHTHTQNAHTYIHTRMLARVRAHAHTHTHSVEQSASCYLNLSIMNLSRMNLSRMKQKSISFMTSRAQPEVLAMARPVSSLDYSNIARHTSFHLSPFLSLCVKKNQPPWSPPPSRHTYLRA
jgi:hypothetical protein